MEGARLAMGGGRKIVGKLKAVRGSAVGCADSYVDKEAVKFDDLTWDRVLFSATKCYGRSVWHSQNVVNKISELRRAIYSATKLVPIGWCCSCTCTIVTIIEIDINNNIIISIF